MQLEAAAYAFCRLKKQGIRVLVERPVHRTEFPEYEAFDAEQDGTTHPNPPASDMPLFGVVGLSTQLS